MVRTFTVIFYFILAIVIFASIGVYVPYIFESIKNKGHSLQDLNQNVVTYFIAIFASATLDLVLKLIDKNDYKKKLSILGLLILCILVVAATAYLLYCNANGSEDKIRAFLIIGIVLSYLMWWIAHYKDEVFNPPANALGGNPAKKLSNG